MSTKALSPAANLLRHSRLMSMPAPVPPPPTFSINAPPASPYPTLQAITTTRSSAHRGDWGLKRGLPLKTSQKSMYVRYQDLDTIEHMTTFESAHDDVYTVKKWQEMDIPIIKDSEFGDYSLEPRSYFQYKCTVFDDEVKTESYKWRFKGPYVPGMGDKELREYIKKSILPRRQEFHDYIVKRQNIDQLRRKYAERNATISQQQLEEEAAAMPVKGVDIMALRADPSYLEKLVTDFLDIPVNKPHRTHTSAGLHYIRSNAYANNDPEAGPQQQKKELLGRQMNFQGSSGCLVGIGGIIARSGRRTKSEDRFVVIKYRPLKGASINAGGRIMLDVEQVVQQPDFYGRGESGE
ncbi:hypothetical protein K440DRAFT_513862, partial [Wilcoxina mikolae CBS 423.85]